MASVVRFDKWEDSEGNPVLDASGGPINFPSRRNLLYNGAMQVHQRGTSVTGITGSGYRTADRWGAVNSALGTWTQTVENDGPTGSGLTKSLKMLCTTADLSPSAPDELRIVQRLEGQDLQGLKKGTSGAQSLIVSFWVKSNVTGDYVFNVADTDNNRLFSQKYTIAASSVWEKKTINVPADTTGVLDNDNATSLLVNFWIAAGTDRTSGSLQTTWGTSVNASLAPGQTNLASATNNYWQITGVQLEVGPSETPFEFKTFGQELAECQRYYYEITASFPGSPLMSGGYYTSTVFYGVAFFPVEMRVAPGVSSAINAWNVFTNNSFRANTTFGINHVSKTAVTIGLTTAAATAGHGGWAEANGSGLAPVKFNAEL